MVLKQKQIKHGEIQNPIREMRCFLLQKLSSWFWLNKRTKGFDGNEEKGNIWCYCKQKTSLKRREAERIQRKKKAVLVSLFLSLPDSNCRSQQQPFLCPLNSSLSVSSCVCRVGYSWRVGRRNGGGRFDKRQRYRAMVFYFMFFSLLVRGCCWALNLLGSYSCPYFKKHGSIQFFLSKRLYFLIKYSHQVSIKI